MSVYSYVFLLYLYLKNYILWDITTYILAKFKPSLACSRPAEIEAIWSSETSGDFHWNTKHYIPEDRTFQDHKCENLKSKISFGNTCVYQISRIPAVRVYAVSSLNEIFLPSSLFIVSNALVVTSFFYLSRRASPSCALRNHMYTVSILPLSVFSQLMIHYTCSYILALNSMQCSHSTMFIFVSVLKHLSNTQCKELIFMCLTVALFCDTKGEIGEPGFEILLYTLHSIPSH
jgi:hypothetical protein